MASLARDNQLKDPDHNDAWGIPVQIWSRRHANLSECAAFSRKPSARRWPIAGAANVDLGRSWTHRWIVWTVDRRGDPRVATVIGPPGTPVGGLSRDDRHSKPQFRGLRGPRVPVSSSVRSCRLSLGRRHRFFNPRRSPRRRCSWRFLERVKPSAPAQGIDGGWPRRELGRCNSDRSSITCDIALSGHRSLAAPSTQFDDDRPLGIGDRPELTL